MSYCRGPHHPKAKLTEADVRMIRELREAGLSYPTIAKKFEVGVMTAWAVVNYWTWRHVH